MGCSHRSYVRRLLSFDSCRRTDVTLQIECVVPSSLRFDAEAHASLAECILVQPGDQSLIAGGAWCPGKAELDILRCGPVLQYSLVLTSPLKSIHLFGKQDKHQAQFDPVANSHFRPRFR